MNPHRTWPLRPVLGALFLGTLAAALLGVACGGSDEEALRRDVLAHLADEVFVPTINDIRDHAAALRPTLSAVCATFDDSSRADADAAWRHTHQLWNVAAAFTIGPVVEQMQAGPLDFWPVRTDTIDEALAAAPDPVDAAYIAGLGTSAKGMPALEYLYYRDPVAGFDGACGYMLALADDIAARTADIAAAWPDQAAAFKTAGEPDSEYPTVQAAIDAIVNASIENLYAMVKGKLDRPLGNLTGSPPDPALVESRFSANSLTELSCNLDGFALVYLGADLRSGGAPGLGALVEARDPDLDARILAQMDVARIALGNIPPPLADALTADRSAVQTARDEIDALRRLIKLDVAQLLNVTLSLSDNDGD